MNMYPHKSHTAPVVLVALLLAAGCGEPDTTSVTRLHLENASDAPVTFIAVGVSEQEVAVAANRLPKPLEPSSVYSAILSRPGNYWVRTEFQEGGHTIQRIDGPLRISRGILDWQFTTLDVRPLYESGDHANRTAASLHGLSRTQPAAGRMSFSNN